MNGLLSLIVLLVAVLCGVFTARVMGRWTHARGMRKWARILLAALSGPVGFIGGILFGIAVFMPRDRQGSPAQPLDMAVSGALLLVPFVVIWVVLRHKAGKSFAPVAASDMNAAPRLGMDAAPLARAPWVCFVGFGAPELKVLTWLARRNGWEVIEGMRHIPSPGDCLVLPDGPEGENQYQAQRLSAQALGIEVMGAGQFRAKASTWQRWWKRDRLRHVPEPSAPSTPPDVPRQATASRKSAAPTRPPPPPPPPPQPQPQPQPPKRASAGSDRITLPRTFLFQYRTSDSGNPARRTVDVRSISTRGLHTYLEGYDLDRQEQRTFRTNRIRGDLTDMETGELISVRHLLSHVRERTEMTYRPDAAPKPRTAKEWQTAVLFTGFSTAHREKLEDIAVAAGWHVRTAIGPTLDYLVTGPRAGRTKVARADELGVSVIDEDQFRLLAI